MDKVVFLSPNFIPIILQSLNLSEASCSAIPNAVEEKLLQIAAKPHKCKLKQIVWCGRIVQNPKNILFLPKLWAQIMHKYPEWEFVIVGDGIDKPLLQRQINKLGLQRIRITGFIDPYPVYETAQIFVFPSYSEGFGMAIIESMAHSCVPIVFDTSPAFHDIIWSGKNGFIAPELDSDRFIEYVDRLMSDSNLITTMGDAARLSIKRFSIEKVYQQWLTLFNQLTVSTTKKQ